MTPTQLTEADHTILMPPDEKWGERGWTFLTQEAAYQKYLELGV